MNDDDEQTVENDHQNCETGSLFGNSDISKHFGISRHHIAKSTIPASQRQAWFFKWYAYRKCTYDMRV